MNAWTQKIVQWPLSLTVTGVVIFCAVVSLLAVYLVRRFWPHPYFKENNELVGFTYAIYGLIYGVLLAFTIVVAWQRFEDTEKLVMHETTLLSELWRDCISARPFIREDIHKNLIAYTRSVIEDEWPAMAARGQTHPKTEEIYERLWAITYVFDPNTKLQSAYMDHYLGRMNELSGTRRLRVLHSRMRVHSVLWLVLLVGALPTMIYPLLFSNKHAFVQVAIMGFIMMIVILGLLVTLSLQYPFSGDVRIEPEPFQDLLDSFYKRMGITGWSRQ